MADVKELFEKIRTHWQCYACKVPPGPKERKDRYLCLENYHLLCVDCKDSCPCGSNVNMSGKSCEFFAKMIDEFPWFHCCFYENGCRELLEEADYEDHRLSCIFQKVKCPRLRCKEKIMLKDLRDHFSADAKHSLKPILLSSNEYSVTWNHALSSHSYRKPFEILQNNEVFYVEAYKSGSLIYFWVYVAISPNAAKNFEYCFTLSNEDEEITYKAKPFSLLMHDFKSIKKTKKALCCEIDTLKGFVTEKEALTLNVKIRCLKEEAKDEDVESGVSLLEVWSLSDSPSK